MVANSFVPLRSGRAREGRLVRADSCVSVCQPSLVLPPTFDSDRVELLYTQGVRRYAYYFISLIGNLRQNL
ncbi:hypothetical protein RGN99_000719 [Acinetobacter baumannii]|uniref:Uncharacterized protein n=2 Tax=Acinetobacter baumannii TaxID=470 RepID=A0A0D5YDI4_ACIBA|nr:hypothetical protein ABUW_0220 [Acinetobacter baumannii]EGJ58646.1 hypothetical protein HMPREF0021_03715 [Acinetobacter baumannii 6013150]PXA52705.1 hypothetical protein DMB35_07415 [Acinetobacter baumannii A424]RSC68097.1 hypothetical protein EGT38_08895 [Acinetobacter sp. FDAARGOS_495]CAM85207.1 hypothetical protein ABAYE0224 [Acinetobacter baumannii AYE]